MPRSYLDPPRPIVALATPPGASALALIRCSGPGSLELAARLFSRPAALLEARTSSLVHGFLVDPGVEGGAARVDEVLVAVYRGPAGPTGEDALDLSCHGSPAVVRRALSLLGHHGFAPALPGEFSFRAFSNGKLDLPRAEAVAELVSAQSEAARAAALARLEGGLSRRLSGARARLLGLLAQIELRLDYGEDEVEEALDPSLIVDLRAELEALASSFKAGRLVSEGLRLVLAGAPNAGKSSLFNLLLREERSIVSPEAGTTRDWIEAGIEVAGQRLRLIDTAGLRETTARIEALGVERSQALVAEAELVVFLADATAPLPGPGQIPRKDAILVWNKVDLLPAREAPPGWIPVSAVDGLGLPALVSALEKAIAERLEEAGGAGGPGETLISSERQKALLDQGLAHLDGVLACLQAGEGLDVLALGLREAAASLGELTGEITTPEILEAIFSGFCVGK